MMLNILKAKWLQTPVVVKLLYFKKKKVIALLTRKQKYQTL